MTIYLVGLLISLFNLYVLFIYKYSVEKMCLENTCHYPPLVLQKEMITHNLLHCKSHKQMWPHSMWLGYVVVQTSFCYLNIPFLENT